MSVSCWSVRLRIFYFTHGYFIFLMVFVIASQFRRGGDFFNSILHGRERWKLFCKLWSVRWLPAVAGQVVRLANVLTPVGWFLVYTLSLHDALPICRKSVV